MPFRDILGGAVWAGWTPASLPAAGTRGVLLAACASEAAVSCSPWLNWHLCEHVLPCTPVSVMTGRRRVSFLCERSVDGASSERPLFIVSSFLWRIYFVAPSAVARRKKTLLLPCVGTKRTSGGKGGAPPCLSSPPGSISVCKARSLLFPHARLKASDNLSYSQYSFFSLQLCRRPFPSKSLCL